jgi:hypothetical protein
MSTERGTVSECGLIPNRQPTEAMFHCCLGHALWEEGVSKDEVWPLQIRLATPRGIANRSRWRHQALERFGKAQDLAQAEEGNGVLLWVGAALKKAGQLERALSAFSEVRSSPPMPCITFWSLTYRDALAHRTGLREGANSSDVVLSAGQVLSRAGPPGRGHQSLSRCSQVRTSTPGSLPRPCLEQTPCITGSCIIDPSPALFHCRAAFENSRPKPEHSFPPAIPRHPLPGR